MKKTTLSPVSSLWSTVNVLSKRFLLTLAGLCIVMVNYAANISSVAAGGNWNSTTTWSPAQVPVNGDNVTIIAGSTVTITAAAACTNLIISGTLTMNNTGFIFKIGNAGSGTGALTLNSGSSFFIGSSNTVEFVATQSGGGIINNGGTIVSSGITGVDGGTVQIDAQSGGNFGISGTSQTIFNNLTFISNASFNLSSSTSPNIFINGTFIIPNNNWGWVGGSKSPIYGPGATVSINNGGQGYTPGGTRYEWQQFAPGAATIGVTPGYPNNVVLANIGTSMSNYNTNTYGMKLSGSWSINGTFQVGTPTVTCFADLNNGGAGGTVFSCGGIIIQNGSKLAGPGASGSFVINGNWLRTGGTIGAYINNSGTVTFAGSGTSGIPQTIGLSTGTEASLYNVTINNGTYVKLNSPVTLPAAGILNLNSGIVETSPANLLNITNSALTGLTGTGSATNYINGPVKWALLSGSNVYSFPVGAGTTYLPLQISVNSGAGIPISVCFKAVTTLFNCLP